MKKFLKRILTATMIGVVFYYLMVVVSGISYKVVDGRWSTGVGALPMPYILYAVIIFALAAWYVAAGVFTVGCAAGYAIGPYYDSLSMYNNGGMLTLVFAAFSLVAAILIQLIFNFIKKKIDENTPA